MYLRGVNIMEIERKFLVKNINELDLSKYNHKTIIQDYLYIDSFTAIRKRKICENNINKFTYTIKTAKVGISVNEIEREITEAEYNNLPINNNYNTIEKERYIIPYENYKIELDVFTGVYTGIVFAEIEFPSEVEAFNLKLPNWFGTEISSNVTNADMAVGPVDKIFDLLNYKIKID